MGAAAINRAMHTTMKLLPNRADRQNTKLENNNEQRRSERFGVRLPVKVTIVRECRRYTITGEGYDFSRGGMRLFLSSALEVGAQLILEFALPYTSTPMVLLSVVRNRNAFTYGVEFSKINPYQQEMLERNCAVLNLLR